MKRLAVCLLAGTCAVALALGVGCTGEEPTPPAATTATSNGSGGTTTQTAPSLGVVGDPQYFEQESDDWVVIEPVRQALTAEDGTELVVEGRIGDISAKYHFLVLVDESLAYCGKGNVDDMCRTPWDF